MIVDPDFLDHWRTGMVIDALGDPMAPIYIMRLWAHCQERKSDVFAIPTRGLKAQCKFPGDADAFEAALIDAGFITRDGDSIHVSGWAERNASLIAAWENGAKGGRPKKGKDNPDETHGLPNDNPLETQHKPIDNPNETQAKPIREDKRREEKKEEKAQAPLPDWIPVEAWDGFTEMRKRIRKPLTARARALVLKSLEDMRSRGIDVEQSLDNSTRNGWVDVYEPKAQQSTSNGTAPKPGTDEYFEKHRHATWWREAGFDSVWEAANSRCWHHNAAQFRDGKRIEVAA